MLVGDVIEDSAAFQEHIRVLGGQQVRDSHFAIAGEVHTAGCGGICNRSDLVVRNVVYTFIFVFDINIPTGSTPRGAAEGQPVLWHDGHGYGEMPDVKKCG